MNRLPPRLPVQAVSTYRVASPISTHTRPATCAEVDCGAHLRGWRTVLDTATSDGATLALYIRTTSGRHFTETRDEAGHAVFVFPPGQTCFAADSHRVSLDRPEHYLVVPGDWRAVTGRVRRHSGPDPWLDDFQSNQQRLARAAE